MSRTLILPRGFSFSSFMNDVLIACFVKFATSAPFVSGDGNIIPQSGRNCNTEEIPADFRRMQALLFLLSARINSEPFGRRIRSKFTFSFATAITVASGVSTAETAIFGGDETVKRPPKKLRENLDFVDTDD